MNMGKGVAGNGVSNRDYREVERVTVIRIHFIQAYLFGVHL